MLGSDKAAMQAKKEIGVKKEFTVLWKGWELDNEAWILNDGRLVATNHGGEYFEDEAWLNERIAEIEENLKGLLEAKKLMQAS